MFSMMSSTAGVYYGQPTSTAQKPRSHFTRVMKKKIRFYHKLTGCTIKELDLHTIIYGICIFFIWDKM